MATLIQIGTVMILLYHYNPIAPIRKLETRHDGKKRDEAPFVLCFAMSYYLGISKYAVKPVEKPLQN